MLVVGGGPAGSSCAWQLRKHGLDVVVMDKAEFPRDKVCAGWITPAVVDALQLDIEAYAADHVLQEISSFRTGMINQTGVINGTDVDTAYRDTVSYGIRRYEFDHYLLQRSGARLLLGKAFAGMARAGDRWLVNNEISAGMVVGAGGHFCPVARFVGARLGAAEAIVAAKEIEFRMNAYQNFNCKVEGDKPELYFCNDLQGYGWCLRKGQYLNIGLGRLDNYQLSSHLEQFCNFLKQRGRIPEIIPEQFRGHAYLLQGYSGRRQCADGILLAGDAAGLAYPQSGEGIRPAVESALLAASVIVEAAGEYSLENLEPYSGKLRAHFGSVAADSGKPHGIIQNFLAKRLLRFKWFNRHVVLNRWFLRNRHAALIIP